MRERQRLVWLCPEFTPYHEVLFDALAADGAFDLRVVIMMGPTESHPFETKDERPYEWDLADPRLRVDEGLIDDLLREEAAWFVVSSYLRPTLMAAMKVLAKAGRPFLYYTDTPLSQKIRWTRSGPEKRSLLRRIGRARRLAWIFANAHRVLATGDFGVGAVEALGCPPEKSVVFPYWVDIGKRPPPRNPARGARRFLGIGQLIFRKGWDVAIEALSRMLDNMRDDTGENAPRVQLRLIGDGRDRWFLEEMIREKNLSSHVILSGWLQPPEVAQALKEADALVHPSRWEPYGVVVMEAMAAGVPVLGSGMTGAVVDRVVDGESGFIHPVDDVARLAWQMEQLVEDGELLAQLSRAARKKAEEWPVQRGVDTIKSIVLDGYGRRRG
ncbi:MAG: glycosyltransferase family 4 protein [Magnetococcales bacterium]|nr:glycosyltransferase family 4 protein [Magnetococcales bacterium]